MEANQAKNTIQQNADLHLIILGSEKKEIFFNTIRRNITERWPLRYDGLGVKEITHFKDAELGTNFDVELTFPKNKQTNPFSLSITSTPEFDDHLQGFDRFKISALFNNAKKIVFTWLVPEDWLLLKTSEALVETIFYQQLVSLRQILDALKDIEPAVLYQVCVFQLVEKKSKFGAKPWATISKKSNQTVLEGLKRQAPRVYQLLADILKMGQLYSIPWSENGSHLDYTPRWIDRFILDDLKVPASSESS